MSFSDYLENKLLDHVFGGTPYTAPAAVYVALSTTAPADDGTGVTEPAGGGYARQAATFGTASAGSISNSATVTFPESTAAWGTITHFALYDAATLGNMLAHGALTTSRTVDAAGITLSFAAGALTVTLD